MSQYNIIEMVTLNLVPKTNFCTPIETRLTTNIPEKIAQNHTLLTKPLITTRNTILNLFSNARLIYKVNTKQLRPLFNTSTLTSINKYDGISLKDSNRNPSKTSNLS